jgi:hypothetical protein
MVGGFNHTFMTRKSAMKVVNLTGGRFICDRHPVWQLKFIRRGAQLQLAAVARPRLDRHGNSEKAGVQRITTLLALAAIL